jgi:hypothetical protein
VTSKGSIDGNICLTFAQGFNRESESESGFEKTLQLDSKKPIL